MRFPTLVSHCNSIDCSLFWLFPMEICFWCPSKITTVITARKRTKHAKAYWDTQYFKVQLIGLLISHKSFFQIHYLYLYVLVVFLPSVFQSVQFPKQQSRTMNKGKEIPWQRQWSLSWDGIHSSRVPLGSVHCSISLRFNLKQLCHLSSRCLCMLGPTEKWRIEKILLWI